MLGRPGGRTAGRPDGGERLLLRGSAGGMAAWRGRGLRVDRLTVAAFWTRPQPVDPEVRGVWVREAGGYIRGLVRPGDGGVAGLHPRPRQAATPPASASPSTAVSLARSSTGSTAWVASASGPGSDCTVCRARARSPAAASALRPCASVLEDLGRTRSTAGIRTSSCRRPSSVRSQADNTRHRSLAEPAGYPDIPMRPATAVKREVEYMHGTLCLRLPTTCAAASSSALARRLTTAKLRQTGDSSSAESQRQTATNTEGEATALARSGRRRIGRRCGCLPGAWVETGHAALPGPGPNRGPNPLPHEPKRRENPLPRPGVFLPSVHRGRSTRSPRPRQAAIPPRRSVQRERPCACDWCSGGTKAYSPHGNHRDVGRGRSWAPA